MNAHTTHGLSLTPPSRTRPGATVTGRSIVKRVPLPGRALDVDAALEPAGHEIVHDVKAKAGAAALPSGRKERIEYLRECSGAGSPDRRRRRTKRTTSGLQFETRDLDPARLAGRRRHGPGVHHKVGEHLCRGFPVGVEASRPGSATTTSWPALAQDGAETGQQSSSQPLTSNRRRSPLAWSAATCLKL